MISIPALASVISKLFAISVKSPIGINSDVLNINAETVIPRSGSISFFVIFDLIVFLLSKLRPFHCVLATMSRFRGKPPCIVADASYKNKPSDFDILHLFDYESIFVSLPACPRKSTGVFHVVKPIPGQCCFVSKCKPNPAYIVIRQI